MRVMTRDIGKHVGQKTALMGWVAAVRNHGKLIFLDLRDKSGIAQCVVSAKNEKLFDLAGKLGSEWVVRLTGEVKPRPEKLINENIDSGQWELSVEELEVLNDAKTLPIPIDKNGLEINEENRVKYRYLDLRRERMQKNVRMRHRIIQFIRHHLDQKEFTEIETPILTKSTPEGARDYLVPSRIYKGKFYALPQSPQQYKQLLMVSGFEKYYQIARCFRDEDTRGDRQPEFTQLDLEMSFVTEEDVMNLIEDLYIKMAENLFPEKMIAQKPFPRITYAEAMKKYKTDRPDLRKDPTDPTELAFAWVVDFPFFEKTDDGGWTFTHNPFSRPKDKWIDSLMKKQNIDKIITTQYDLVLNGYEIGGGSIRNHRPEALRKVFEIMGMENETINANFGHMLEALSYGAPPHGGIAPGIDRTVMVLMGEPNIREVIAFPKTGDLRDPMMSTPSEVAQEQLKELALEVKISKKKNDGKTKKRKNAGSNKS